jgi:hypothetical protein
MSVTSALVDAETLVVVNVIVADPAVDPAPPGYLLIGLQPGQECQAGYIYDPATGTFSPAPEPT